MYDDIGCLIPKKFRLLNNIFLSLLYILPGEVSLEAGCLDDNLGHKKNGDKDIEESGLLKNTLVRLILAILPSQLHL